MHTAFFFYFICVIASIITVVFMHHFEEEEIFCLYNVCHLPKSRVSDLHSFSHTLGFCNMAAPIEKFVRSYADQKPLTWEDAKDHVY